MTDYPHQPGSPMFDGAEAYEAHLRAQLQAENERLRAALVVAVEAFAGHFDDECDIYRRGQDTA